MKKKLRTGLAVPLVGLSFVHSMQHLFRIFQPYIFPFSLLISSLSLYQGREDFKKLYQRFPSPFSVLGLIHPCCNSRDISRATSVMNLTQTMSPSLSIKLQCRAVQSASMDLMAASPLVIVCMGVRT